MHLLLWPFIHTRWDTLRYTQFHSKQLELCRRLHRWIFLACCRGACVWCWRCLTVTSPVKTKMIWTGESPSTLITLEWFVSCVFSVVSSQFIRPSKTPGTLWPWTDIGLLSCVSSNVCFQVRALSVHLATSLKRALVKLSTCHGVNLNLWPTTWAQKMSTHVSLSVSLALCLSAYLSVYLFSVCVIHHWWPLMSDCQFSLLRLWPFFCHNSSSPSASSSVCLSVCVPLLSVCQSVCLLVSSICQPICLSIHTFSNMEGKQWNSQSKKSIYAMGPSVNIAHAHFSVTPSLSKNGHTHTEK